MHRRQLPIVGPCDGFEPAPGSEQGEGGFCEGCKRQVHDVSILSEPELHELMAAHAGQRVCLSYRVDGRGQVRLRPEPPPQWSRSWSRPVTLGTLALLLAACAGHFTEADAPGWSCRDPDGYEVQCDAWGGADMVSAPDEPEPSGGCPVQPVPKAFSDEVPIEPVPIEPMPIEDAPGEVDPEPAGEPWLEPHDDVPPGAARTSMKFRANFSIDPSGEITRTIGIVIGWSSQDPRTGRLRYVSTKSLWNDWRVRRAERKAARERRRMAARR